MELSLKISKKGIICSWNTKFDCAMMEKNKYTGQPKNVSKTLAYFGVFFVQKQNVFLFHQLK